MYLPYDRSTDSSKASSPHRAIYYFNCQFTVAAYLFFLVFSSLLFYPLFFLLQSDSEGSSYQHVNKPSIFPTFYCE